MCDLRQDDKTGRSKYTIVYVYTDGKVQYLRYELTADELETELRNMFVVFAFRGWAPCIFMLHTNMVLRPRIIQREEIETDVTEIHKNVSEITEDVNSIDWALDL